MPVARCWSSGQPLHQFSVIAYSALQSIQLLMRFLSSTNGTEPPLRTRISLLLTSYVFLPKKLQFTQNFTRQGDAPSAFAALFHIPHSAPFPFKVLQLIFYKTQEVTLSPGCAHLKRLKTKYGISLCCFLSHCRSRSCLVFCFFLSHRDELRRSAEHALKLQLSIF